TSFIRLGQQNLGFQAHNLWVGAVNLKNSRYTDEASRRLVVERMLAALREAKGIQTAAVSSDIPLATGNRTLYARADRDVPPTENRATAPSHDIAPGYLKTWGIPLIAGRDFDEHDVAGGRNVCLISHAGANYRDRRRCPQPTPRGRARHGVLPALGAGKCSVPEHCRSQQVEARRH